MSHLLERRLFWWTAITLISLLAALRATERIWPSMTRPFWQDECRHNVAIIEASSPLDTFSRTADMSQPILEYLVRQLVWFPAFGHQERGLRLPNFVYFLALVIAGVFLSASVLRGRKHPLSYALLGAILAGVWKSSKPDEAWAGSVARHYSLVSLLSLWWFHLTILAKDRPKALWLAVSLVFANTHFFALPLIATAGLLDALACLRDRQTRGAAFAATGTLAVIAGTIAINHAAWNVLTGAPPGEKQPLLAGLLDGCRTWWGFVRYVHLPVIAAVIWAGLLVAAKRRDAGRLLVFVLVVIPLFLVALRIKSQYPFAGRYYTPFFGAAFITLVLALDQGRLLLENMLRRVRLRDNGRRIIRWTAVVALIAMFNVGPACRDLVRRRGALARLPENSSPTFVMYEAIKEISRPTLIISECCWNDVSHRLFLLHIGKPFKKELRMIRAGGCQGSSTDIEFEVGRFLTDNPSGLIVLDQTESIDNICGSAPKKPLGGRLAIQKVPGGLCAWNVQGARKSSDVLRAAQSVDFRSLRWWHIK